MAVATTWIAEVGGSWPGGFILEAIIRLPSKLQKKNLIAQLESESKTNAGTSILTSPAPKWFGDHTAEASRHPPPCPPPSGWLPRAGWLGPAGHGGPPAALRAPPQSAGCTATGCPVPAVPQPHPSIPISLCRPQPGEVGKNGREAAGWTKGQNSKKKKSFTLILCKRFFF